MTAFRINRLAAFGLLLCLALSAHAQVEPETVNDTGREASFLPAPDTPSPGANAPDAIAGSAPLVLVPQPAPTVPVSPVPTAQAVAPSSASAAPVAPSPTVNNAVVAKTIDLGKPVESASLTDINPESIGLMSVSQGGLGAGMWKGTSRALAERLLPALNLPENSPTLNNLAARLLLTTASVPEGTPSGNLSFTAIRIERLLALGNVNEAWKLAMATKPDQIDEITLRLTAEAASVSDVKDDVCTKLPEIIKIHNGIDWQKLMLVCQLRAKDSKAAQVTLDLLHTQGVKDDNYFYIAEKNILGANKQLPRQLTPLKPLSLALLSLADLPLPVEVYARPDIVLVPTLLKLKARDDTARLTLAERMAERGIITGSELASIYHSIVFPPDKFIAVTNSPESGPRLHALLYQAAVQDKTPQNRIDAAIKFMQSASPMLLNGPGAQVLADMVADIPPVADYNASSGAMAHIYTLANKPDAALAWIKLAKHALIGIPSVAEELHNFWPLAVLSGLESDGDYAQDLGKWVDGELQSIDPKDPSKQDGRAQREAAASVLALLDAMGFAIPEDDWAKVADGSGFERHLMPPVFLFEHLRSASVANKRGETVLLGLLLTGGGTGESSLLAVVETVRALRLVGLTADAAMLAREGLSTVLSGTTSKPHAL
jgi:hypothetical protein